MTKCEPFPITVVFDVELLFTLCCNSDTSVAMDKILQKLCLDNVSMIQILNAIKQKILKEGKVITDKSERYFETNQIITK